MSLEDAIIYLADAIKNHGGAVTYRTGTVRAPAGELKSVDDNRKFTEPSAGGDLVEEPKPAKKAAKKKATRRKAELKPKPVVEELDILGDPVVAAPAITLENIRETLGKVLKVYKNSDKAREAFTAVDAENMSDLKEDQYEAIQALLENLLAGK